MSTVNSPLKALRQALRNKSLRSLTAFRAVGEFVRASVVDDRGAYGQKELQKLGKELRMKFRHFNWPLDPTGMLQAARRVAEAFTEEQVERLESRKNDDYRLSNIHLRHLASTKITKKDRAKWITRCIKGRWSVKTLHAELRAQFPGRSQGGRRLKSPLAGVQTAQRALQAVERLLNAEVATERAAKRKKAQAASLQQLQQCQKLLAKLAKRWTPS